MTIVHNLFSSAVSQRIIYISPLSPRESFLNWDKRVTYYENVHSLVIVLMISITIPFVLMLTSVSFLCNILPVPMQ